MIDHHVRPLEGETQDHLQERVAEITHKLSQRLQRLEQGDTDESSLEDLAMIGIVREQRSGDSYSVHRIIGGLLIEILRYLYEIGETAVATSIWHSLRVDAIRVTEDSDADGDGDSGEIETEMPDEVSELMIRKDLIEDEPWQLFQLERDRQGSCHQTWLINRILRSGSFWVGSYIDHCLDMEGVDEEIKAVLYSSVKSKTKAKPEYDTFLTRQFMRQTLAASYRAGADGQDQEEDSSGLHAAASLMNYIYRSELKEEKETRRSEQVSVFDVDGPCIVATPFDANREILPHSEDRGASVCWVVEPAVSIEDTKQEMIEVTGLPAPPACDPERINPARAQQEEQKETADAVLARSK